MRPASKRSASTRLRSFNEILAEPGRVRIREHDDPRVHRRRDRFYAPRPHSSAQTLRRPTSSPTQCTRRRRASSSSPTTRIRSSSVRSRSPRSAKRRSPSRRRISARSTAACGRASTRRARARQVRSLGSVRLRQHRHERGTRQRLRSPEHRRGRRRHEGLRPLARRPDVRLHATRRASSAAPGGGFKLQAADRDALRGLRRRAVVRRRDGRRRRARLLRHQSRHPARAGGAHRNRTDARQRVHRTPARRLLVQVAGCAARPVGAGVVHAHDGQGVCGKRIQTARRSCSTPKTPSSCCGASAGRSPATSACCGRSPARRGSTTRSTRIGRSARRRSRSAGRTRSPSRSPTTITRCSTWASAQTSAASRASCIGTASAGRGDTNYYAITAGIRAPL